jgi:hypothetical protein
LCARTAQKLTKSGPNICLLNCLVWEACGHHKAALVGLRPPVPHSSCCHCEGPTSSPLVPLQTGAEIRQRVSFLIMHNIHSFQTLVSPINPQASGLLTAWEREQTLGTLPSGLQLAGSLDFTTEGGNITNRSHGEFSHNRWPFAQLKPIPFTCYNHLLYLPNP